tara:strand:+ start:284 stop:688 length:405 start_codon:yes stop_codon:yes gene_type:complete
MDKTTFGFGKEAKMHSMTDHPQLHVPSNARPPVVRVSVLIDRNPHDKGSHKGYNVKVDVDNFKFDAESVNKSSAYNKGHAHIFINGEKKARMYCNMHYFKSLPSKAKVSVSLVTNMHEDIIYKGKKVEHSTMVR